MPFCRVCTSEAPESTESYRILRGGSSSNGILLLVDPALMESYCWWIQLYYSPISGGSTSTTIL
eukprot:5181941-Pyramimonas_sp.AAC.1